MLEKLIPKILPGGLSACGVGFIVTFVVISVLRMDYPFELEWMEGGILDHVYRVLEGQKIYVKPTLEFVPFIYAPLYFYVSALFSLVLGESFFPLRLVSFLASIGSLTSIFFIVRRETGGIIYPVIAAGLFAATFRISGAWFDIARADALFLCLVLLTLLILQSGTSTKRQVAAAVLITLAFLTKQTALVIGLPLAIYLLWVCRLKALVFIGISVVLIGGSTLLLDYIHDGWYSYYLFFIPGQHHWTESMYIRFWTEDILGSMFAASGLAAFYLFRRLRAEGSSDRVFLLVAAAGMLAGSWAGRLHSGGYDNVLLPAYAILAILFGLGLHKVRALVDESPFFRYRMIESGVLIVCLLQFYMLRYDPAKQLPTDADMQTGRALVERLPLIKGEVLIPSHGYLAVMSGKRGYAHKMAIGDIIRGDEKYGAELKTEIHEALKERRFEGIIIDGTWFPEILERYYTNQGSISGEPDLFYPVTGFPTRPKHYFGPKKSEPLQ